MWMLVFPGLVGMLVFAVGLQARRDDLLLIWRQPWLLARSFAAMYLLVPLVAVAMVSVFDLPAHTRAALLLLAISAGAPLLPRRLIGLGSNPAYAFGLVVAASLLAVFTVPLSLVLLARWLPVELAISPGRVAVTLGISFLLPLLAGMLIGRLFPRQAARLAEPLFRVGMIALAIGLAALLIINRQILAHLGLPTFLTFAGFSLAALAIGHFLGGTCHRLPLAVACATRHVNLVLVITVAVRGPRAMAMVCVYLIVSLSNSLLYTRLVRGWQQRADRLPQQ